MKNATFAAAIILGLAILGSALVIAAGLARIGSPASTGPTVAPAAAIRPSEGTDWQGETRSPTTNPATWGDSLLAADEILQPGDIVEVTVNDITGPGVASTRVCRIGHNGKIRLWLIGDVEAAGMGADKLEPAISDAYGKAQYISHAIVAVTARRPGN